jgi:hypothetical protein
MSATEGALAADVAKTLGQNGAAAWLLQLAVSLDQAPSVVWSFVSHMGSGLLRADARRGLIMLGLMLCLSAFIMWLILRLFRALLYRIAKGVMMDVLRDEQVAQLGTKRFVSAMVAANNDQNNTESLAAVLWSPACSRNFKKVIGDLLMDDNFVKGAASLIRDLTVMDNLTSAVKTQIREFLKDQNIHRALLEGSLEALKPEWVAKLRKPKVGEDPSPSERRSTAIKATKVEM